MIEFQWFLLMLLLKKLKASSIQSKTWIWSNHRRDAQKNSSISFGWHMLCCFFWLLLRLKSYFPNSFCQLLRCYLTYCPFHVKHEDSLSEIKLIWARVPQGNILGPVLYQLYIADVVLIVYEHRLTMRQLWWLKVWLKCQL